MASQGCQRVRLGHEWKKGEPEIGVLILKLYTKVYDKDSVPTASRA